GDCEAECSNRYTSRPHLSNSSHHFPTPEFPNTTVSVSSLLGRQLHRGVVKAALDNPRRNEEDQLLISIVDHGPPEEVSEEWNILQERHPRDRIAVGNLVDSAHRERLSAGDEH